MRSKVGLVILVLAFAACGGSSDRPTLGEPAAANIGGSSVEATIDAEVSGTALCSFGSNGCSERADPEIGQRAPTFAATGPRGNDVSFNHGVPTVLIFVAHWCAPCGNELAELASLRPDQIVGDVVVISTAQDPEKAHWPPSQWLAASEWLGPTVADDVDVSIAHAYGVTGLPYFVAIDAAGAVIRRGTGEQSVAELQQLLSS